MKFGLLEIMNSQLKVWIDLSYTGSYEVQERREIQTEELLNITVC